MEQGRLFKIVYHLLDKGRATAPELAEKFEVSVRTIYRDLDAISAAGIPIYTVQGKGGGIFILPEFVLEKSLLTPQEKEQILMALQGLAAAEDSRTDELLTKLGGLFRVQGANWIEVDFSDWHKNTAGAELFDELKRAVFSCRRVSFSYFAGEGGTVRTVEPVKLIFKSKDWYLYGFCLLRNDLPLFQADPHQEFDASAGDLPAQEGGCPGAKTDDTAGAADFGKAEVLPGGCLPRL